MAQPGTYFVHNQYGSFCTACGEHMSLEEEDWGVCDCCGGDGFPEDDVSIDAQSKPETEQGEK